MRGRERARTAISEAGAVLGRQPRSVRWNPGVIVAYAVLILGLVVMEAIGIRSGRDSWPSITDITLKLMAHAGAAAGLVLAFLSWVPIHMATEGRVGPIELIIMLVAGAAIGGTADKLRSR